MTKESYITKLHEIAILFKKNRTLLVEKANENGIIITTHYKGLHQLMTGETLVNSEMNLQVNFAILKIIIDLSRNEKIGKTQMDRILKLKDELTDYYTNRSFTNDTDLKYLRKIQET